MKCLTDKTQLSLLSLIALGLLTWTVAHYATAIAGTPEDLTLEEYRRIQHIRDRIGVTNQRLARVSADRTQAETLLQQVKQWHAANQSRLEQVDAAEAAQHARLTEAVRSIGVGPEQPMAGVPCAVKMAGAIAD